jgi:hypothetical protein
MRIINAIYSKQINADCPENPLIARGFVSTGPFRCYNNLQSFYTARKHKAD